MFPAGAVNSLTPRPERARLDAILAERPNSIDATTRAKIWESADRILAHGPGASAGSVGENGLALGYVQSGKTTAIMALIAAGADAGYRVIVALLGVTNLLLEQNTSRIERAFGIGDRNDYRWVVLRNPKGALGARALAGWLERDRVVLVPVLKHAGRIKALSDVVKLVNPDQMPVLIVDDEGDQASLNTKVAEGAESETYSAIRQLKESAPRHLYVQYTATPYAPLLLEPENTLAPDFIELLQPGPGYTGGREFFVDEAYRVVRPIPTIDEQTPRGLPTQLPDSLVRATAAFVAGAGLLLTNGQVAPPISMLVHATHKTDAQERYRFLMDRLIRRWREAMDESGRPPTEVSEERLRLVEADAKDVPDAEFVRGVDKALRETTIWLVNSASDVRKIDWSVAPIHVLVGGNKLDRGFTVEGLTVTYMNRPASPQVDTLEQRARAYGYRTDLIPYCQFFGSPRTIETLRGIVFTEYDLRAELEDWIDRGGSISEWARRIGLLLPPGTKPTRDSVLLAVNRFNEFGEGWHSLRRPSLTEPARNANAQLIAALGLLDAPFKRYGRLSHRTADVALRTVTDRVLEPWEHASYSPGWRHDEILQFLRRHDAQRSVARVVLMEREGGGPRERRWDRELGFVNLFQGPDLDFVEGSNAYPGDRNLGSHGAGDPIELQVHRVHPRPDLGVDELFTLAINLGQQVMVRRGASD